MKFQDFVTFHDFFLSLYTCFVFILIELPLDYAQVIRAMFLDEALIRMRRSLEGGTYSDLSFNDVALVKGRLLFEARYLYQHRSHKREANFSSHT